MDAHQGIAGQGAVQTGHLDIGAGCPQRLTIENGLCAP